MHVRKSLQDNQKGQLLEALVLIRNRREFIFEDSPTNDIKHFEEADFAGSGTPKNLYSALRKLDQLGYIEIEPHSCTDDDEYVKATLTKKGKNLYNLIVNYLGDLLQN